MYLTQKPNHRPQTDNDSGQQHQTSNLPSKYSRYIFHIGSFNPKWKRMLLFFVRLYRPELLIWSNPHPVSHIATFTQNAANINSLQEFFYKLISRLFPIILISFPSPSSPISPSSNNFSPFSLQSSQRTQQAVTEPSRTYLICFGCILNQIDLLYHKIKSKILASPTSNNHSDILMQGVAVRLWAKIAENACMVLPAHPPCAYYW